jgi:hypothetical protein
MITERWRMDTASDANWYLLISDHTRRKNIYAGASSFLYVPKCNVLEIN